MKILSLFDGISCGQIALNRVGIFIEKYYASEIDKYSIATTQYNYPKTKQIGDITKIDVNELPKIDLLIGGSPCQGFSFAGKHLNFNDPRSKLFFEYVRILNDLRKNTPDIKFLLENVRMKKESQNIITKHLRVEPIAINSNLVSAQNRYRLYWTNINNIEQPIDKHIYLKDIIEKNINVLKNFKVNKTPSRIKMWEGKCKNITNELKSSCVVTKQDRWNSQGLIKFDGFCRFLTPIENERLQTIPDNYTKINNPNFKNKLLTSIQRDFMIGNGYTVDVIAHILKNISNKFTKKQIKKDTFLYE